MRYTALLPLAVAVSAIAVPGKAPIGPFALKGRAGAVGSRGFVAAYGDQIRQSHGGSSDSVAQKASDLRDYVAKDELDLFGDSKAKRDGGNYPDITIYQAIHMTQYLTKLAAAIDQYPDLIAALNSTQAPLTLFAPTDQAFDNLPDSQKNPSKELLMLILEYHVLPGSYAASDILARDTLGTVLTEEKLGGRAQRLRFCLSSGSVYINFYSKVIATNYFFANGVIHGIDNVLIPPNLSDQIVASYPDEFSSFLAAGQATGIARTGQEMDTGLTMFAPTNEAFAKLGADTANYLFNTTEGKKQLTAIILFHLVVNETLYSDAYYPLDVKTDLEPLIPGADGTYQASLTTLLGVQLSVDITKYCGVTTVIANGCAQVAVADGIAKDGVVHTINEVLIPPSKKRGEYKRGTELSVEELIERLEPYVQAL